MSSVCGRSVVKATVDMDVLPKVAAAVHISSPSGPVCSGVPVTFTATSENPGTLPDYYGTGKDGVHMMCEVAVPAANVAA